VFMVIEGMEDLVILATVTATETTIRGSTSTNEDNDPGNKNRVTPNAFT
jgi:hypothetical protein